MQWIYIIFTYTLVVPSCFSLRDASKHIFFTSEGQVENLTSSQSNTMIDLSWHWFLKLTLLYRKIIFFHTMEVEFTKYSRYRPSAIFKLTGTIFKIEKVFDSMTSIPWPNFIELGSVDDVLGQDKDQISHRLQAFR